MPFDTFIHLSDKDATYTCTSLSNFIDIGYYTEKTPSEKCNELASKTPYWEDTSADFAIERDQQIKQKRAFLFKARF